MQQIVRTFWIVLRPLYRLHVRLFRPLTLGVRAIVLDSEGRVLLVRHSYVDGWYLPGGGVERGETALSAVTREIDEEAGILLKAGERLQLLGFLANFREFKSDHVVLYLVGPTQYESVARTSFEIAEYGFYAIDDVPEETTRGTRARLSEFKSGTPAPDMW